MSKHVITESICDMCGRTPNGDSPDFLYAMNCKGDHDICSECRPKFKIDGSAGQFTNCPVCDGQVEAYKAAKKAEREERRRKK